ncbi:MAG: tetratricopeptide repeat protein [Bacteroidia bacterium]
MDSYHHDKEITPGMNDSPGEKEKKFLLGLEKYPEAKGHFLRQLMILYAFPMKRPAKALQCCYRILDECTKKDDLTEAYYFLSDHFSEKEEFSLAVSNMEKVLELDAGDYEAILRIGNIYIEQELYDKAEETFKRLLSMTNFDGKICEEEYYEAMAELYEVMDEPQKALECREVLLGKSENNKSSAERHKQIAAEYNGSGKTEQAKEHYQKAIDLFIAELDKTGTGTEEVKKDGYSTWVNHDTDRINLLENIAYTWSLADNQHQAAIWYGKTIEAIETLLLQSNDKPNLGYFESHLPGLYCTIGNNKKAIALYEKLLAAPSRFQSIEFYYRGLAEAYKDESNFDKACEYWLKILDKNNESGEAILSLASIYYDQKKFDIAKPYLERYIELYPNQNARAYSSLAFCFDYKEEPETVLTYLHNALKVNTDKDRELAAGIYAAMGKVYWYQLKDAENAIDSFRKMMQHKPSTENIADAGTVVLVLSFTPEGSDLAMKFWEDFPVQQTAAPQGARLTQKQIRELPYYHGKIPKNATEMLRWKKQIAKDFEDDLQNNALYKEYFAKYSPESVTHFIHLYARHKEMLVSSGDAYMKEKEEREEEYLLKDANNIFDLILQKKLFNMQLLWRAEQLTIPQVQISYDFEMWSQTDYGTYTECPFIDEVTSEDIQVMKQFLADSNFSDSTKWWMHGWQDYKELTQRFGDDDMEFMPEWYEFYDSRMGTGSLLTLPDLRGDKEENYKNMYRDWKNKQPNDPLPPPADQPLYISDIFPNDNEYSAFMNVFENNYLNLLQKRHCEEFEYPDKYYPKDRLEDAILELEHAKVPVYVEGGMLWHEAIILAARKYKNNLMAEKLDEVYHDYLMKRELLSGIPVSNGPDGSAGGTLRDLNRATFAEQILKGRELNGEPRDFNF